MQQILDALRAHPVSSADTGGRKTDDAKLLERVLCNANRGIAGPRRYTKKALMPYYLRVKREDKALWLSWDIDEQTEVRLLHMLQVKPRRSASGVATVTVLTKPMPCSGNCLYCPSDMTMPKSYLADEPACQRAQRNYFDPYLQVVTRLDTLAQMGHITDKVELIVLGGTWCDYPEEYRLWYVWQLFSALNDVGTVRAQDAAAARRNFYEHVGLSHDKDVLRAQAKAVQQRVDAGELSYSEAWNLLYGRSHVWQAIAHEQHATWQQVETQQDTNVNAAHRCVGLVFETRPDSVTAETLIDLRHLGCTKVQLGIQSLNAPTLAAGHRVIADEILREAFALTRLAGFKIHAHFMANLPSATPEADKRDYARFVTDPAWLPDEVKLYPCVLIGGTGLQRLYESGNWAPYSEDDLIDVLAEDMRVTPAYTRVSRMIRDFSAHDIMAGSKKVNLRQAVDAHLAEQGVHVSEIRSREIATATADVTQLRLDDVCYETTVSTEHFLQWVTPDNKIAGFLRLSLPMRDAVNGRAGLPVKAGQAMIREVHVYGAVAGLHRTGSGAQHQGLGRQLVEHACALAHEAGYDSMNVISAVGTRAYYAHLGFADAGLYQCRRLGRTE